MSASAPSAVTGRRAERSDLAAAIAAMRGQLGLVALLVGLTALAWWSTADRMAGMDGGPGTDLGPFGWFLGVWVVMMAAMMLPSLAPTTALYARMTRRRDMIRPILFTAGYLVVWGASGVLAYAVYRLGRAALGSELGWSGGGRWVAAGILAFGAVYELSPLKHICLAKCRSPLGFLLGTWRDGWLGAVQMGAKAAGWCLGCCWVLMAALFALGIMSVTWMALVVALIAVEKILPWRRVANYGTAVVLLALAVGMAAVPSDIPGLVVPGSGGATHAMGAMHTMR